MGATPVTRRLTQRSAHGPLHTAIYVHCAVHIRMTTDYSQWNRADRDTPRPSPVGVIPFVKVALRRQRVPFPLIRFPDHDSFTHAAHTQDHFTVSPARRSGCVLMPNIPIVPVKGCLRGFGLCDSFVGVRVC